MERIKKSIANVVKWFKDLSKLQQLLAVGVVVLVGIFSGRAILGSGLNGTYTTEIGGGTVTAVFHGKTGTLTLEHDGDTEKIELEEINLDTQTMLAKSSKYDKTEKMKFKKEGNTLKLYESTDSDADVMMTLTKE